MLPIGMIVEHRYPNADGVTDYEIRDDGDGPYIAYWNEAKLGQKPTEADLRSWWLGAEKWGKKRQLRDADDTEYDRLLSPEGLMTKMERDEVIEKKAAERAGVPQKFVAAEPEMSQKIDALRQKRVDRFKAVNDVSQQSGETLEQTVERVRAITW